MTSPSAETGLRELNDTLESRVAEEIASRQQMEEALRQSQKMEAVGQLTGGIAHDFNNLLTVIIGNVDMAARRLGDHADPRIRRALENAAKGAERASTLTQRLLAFSRRQPLDPKPTDIGRLLRGMADLLTRSIGESVRIEMSAPPDLWRVEVDPNQLENALLNLAVNARDAMDGDGILRITAGNATAAPGSTARSRLELGDYVSIAVADTGSGMSPETIERAFDPFFTTKEVGKSTGLGLSMVYGFVKQSGGEIEIRSATDQGTTVTLYLPRLLVGEEELGQMAEERAREGSLSETVLVVEDDADVRAYTVETLAELGYQVLEASDGAAAVRLLERQDQAVELVLTDVVMPGMSGREVAESARAARPGIKILYTSGYPRESILNGDRLQAGVDLLPKPFTYQDLAAKVRDVLDH